MWVFAVESLTKMEPGDRRHAEPAGQQAEHLGLPLGQLRAGRGHPAPHRVGQVGGGERARARPARAGRPRPPRRRGRPSRRRRRRRPRGRRRAARRRRTSSGRRPRCRGRRDRISRTRSRPVPSGSRTSVITTSGLRARTGAGPRRRRRPGRRPRSRRAARRRAPDPGGSGRGHRSAAHASALRSSGYRPSSR